MADFEYWYPWYPARFRADTMHLTLEQDGCYRRLIDHYMETRVPLPNNDIALARIAGISITDWETIKINILPFFDNGKKDFAILCHKKCDKVLSEQTAIKGSFSSKRAIAGKLGAIKRWGTQDTKKSEKNSKPQILPSKKHSKAIAKNGYTTVENSTVQTSFLDSEDKSSSSSPKRISHQIDFDFELMAFSGITDDLLEFWKTKSYPAIDVQRTINAAASWLMANPKNRKSNYQKFLTSWMERAQQRAPRVAGNDAKPLGGRLKTGQEGWK